MKNLLWSCILFGSLVLISCGPRNPNLAQTILGKWEIQQTAKGGDDANAIAPWIKFHTDFTFDSENTPMTSPKGKWSVDELTNKLTLTPIQQESSATSWDVMIENKSMTWNLESNTDVAVAFTKKKTTIL